MEQETWSEEIALSNYHDLKELLEEALEKAGSASDPREAKGFLIGVQQHFKGLMLRHEQREELYSRLQEAFFEVNLKLEKERLAFEKDATANYHELAPLVAEAMQRVDGSEDLKGTWDYLLEISQRLKEAKLIHDHREELYHKLQDAFEAVKRRREEERLTMEAEARRNYLRLKPMVDEVFTQAAVTHEYKETREFLKKIQTEFKGLRMIREQREELYARLRAAHEILDRRVDDFFRNKKKNWAVKMQYTLSGFEADIFRLQQSIEKETAELDELRDQHEILRTAGKGREVLVAMQARIGSLVTDLDNKRKKIAELEAGKSALMLRLEEPDNQQS